MWMRRASSTLGVGLLITLILVAPVRASADDSPFSEVFTVGGTGVYRQLDQFESADLTIIAGDRDLTASEAERLYSWQDDFARIVDVARSSFPDSFVTAEITNAEPIAGWIAFVDVPRDWVARAFADFPVRIEVRAAPSSPTEVEREAAVEAVHFGVMGTPGVETAASSIDPLTGAIQVEYVLQGGAQASRARSALAEMASGAFPSASGSPGGPPSVTLIERGRLDQGTEALSGGAQLTRYGANYCTAAFTVYKNGVNGILTAAHCAPPLKYGSSITLTNQASTTGSNGDLRWLSSSQAITNRTYTTATTTVNITATGGPVVGQTLSFYGRSSGPSYDRVLGLSQCEGSYCNLTMMEKHLTTGGDSGGGWRSGHTAYGVHHGWKTYDGAERALFTRVGLANVALGVAIKTTP